MSAIVDEVPGPDDAGVFLAISAGNYAEADLAFWRLKAVFGDRTMTAVEALHLDKLRQRRKDAYADLIAWAMTTEAQRQGVTS